MATKTLLSVKDELLLNDNTISLQYKTFILINAALHKSSLLDELYNNDMLWRNEEIAEEKNTNSLWYFNPTWFTSNASTKHKQMREFYTLLDFHVKDALSSEYYGLEFSEGMGLGLFSRINSTVDEMAENIPGYLEFIQEALFKTLQLLGHKSLYSFKDTNDMKQYCILYGPLSFVNSDETIPVGFLQCDPVIHEQLLYYEFVYSIHTYRQVTYYKGRDRNLLHRQYTCSAHPFDTTANDVYTTPRVSIDSHRIPKTERITELVSRVKMSWNGPLHENIPARTLQPGQQIFISYKYINREEPVYIDLTNINDNDESDEHAEDQQPDQDEEYEDNENDEDEEQQVDEEEEDDEDEEQEEVDASETEDKNGRR
jgi:hypothetical protein